MFLSKGFGSAMIITGTSIGAGMLAIPATVAASGFWLACVLLMVTWFVMMITALLLAEVNFAMANGTNFNRMAFNTLGLPGQMITWVAYLLLLYSLTAAYSAGGERLVLSGFSMFGIQLPSWLGGLIFILILGSFVYAGTTAVDHANKLLMLFKFIAFFAFIFAILPSVKQSYLNISTKNFNYIWATFPILITSFGFHHIIPTLRTYVGSDQKTLKNAIILGSFIPLIIYIIWCSATLGSIPLEGTDGFQKIIASSDITAGIVSSYHKHFIGKLAYAFEAIAITTSFLGVTLGLFDFNRDTYRLQKKSHSARFIAFIITFLPPFLFAVFYPSGFKAALGYASIFVAVLLIGLPAAMLWVVRARQKRLGTFAKVYLSMIILIAFSMIALEIATTLNLLPSL